VICRPARPSQVQNCIVADQTRWKHIGVDRTMWKQIEARQSRLIHRAHSPHMPQASSAFYGTPSKEKSFWQNYFSKLGEVLAS